VVLRARAVSKGLTCYRPGTSCRRSRPAPAHDLRPSRAYDLLALVRGRLLGASRPASCVGLRAPPEPWPDPGPVLLTPHARRAATVIPILSGWGRPGSPTAR
jgi:hypothetical protein